jgi:hypothetical protein
VKSFFVFPAKIIDEPAMMGRPIIDEQKDTPPSLQRHFHEPIEILLSLFL